MRNFGYLNYIFGAMECIQKYFIHNKIIKSCKDFNESVIETGLSVYEIIRVENGLPLFIDDHLERLYTSAAIFNLVIEESGKEIKHFIQTLIHKNQVKKGKIKLVIHFNSKITSEQNLLLYFTTYYFPSQQEYKNGVTVGLCKAIRTNPNAKVLNIQARRRANNIIVENKFFEVLLLDVNDFITEGSRSNVFFIQDDIIYTPPEKNVLQGITRKNILQICKNHDFSVIEKNIHLSELKKFDALFLSGTSLKILPIKNIEKDFFDTKNNTLQKLMTLYNQLIENYIEKKLR